MQELGQDSAVSAPTHTGRFQVSLAQVLLFMTGLALLLGGSRALGSPRTYREFLVYYPMAVLGGGLTVGLTVGGLLGERRRGIVGAMAVPILLFLVPVLLFLPNLIDVLSEPVGQSFPPGATVAFILAMAVPGSLACRKPSAAVWEWAKLCFVVINVAGILVVAVLMTAMVTGTGGSFSPPTWFKPGQSVLGYLIIVLSVCWELYTIGAVCWLLARGVIIVFDKLLSLASRRTKASSH